MGCSDWADEIREAVSDTPGPERHVRLRAHVAECASCRASYDTACAAVAALEGNPGGLPEAVMDGLAPVLFARLEAEGALAPASPVRRLSAPRIFWGAVAAVGAVAAGLFVGLGGPGGEASETRSGQVPPAASEFAARGGAQHDVGFGMFCIGLDGETARIESSATSGSSRAAQCRLTDRVQFTYSLHASAARPAPSSLALFAVGPQGELAWYWPRGDGGLRLESEVRQAPLPGSFELSVRHTVGRWRVFGVFATTPLTRESIEARLGRGSTMALRELESLEGFTILEASMEIMDAKRRSP